MTESYRIIGKTLTGLEAVLRDELREMGVADAEAYNRLVTFTGDTRILYRANIRSRTAIRFLRLLKKFNVTDEKDLYKQIGEIDWSLYLDAAGSLAIDPVVSNSTFTHSLYVAQLAKDAIVDQFRERTGVRPSVSLDGPDLRLNLHMNQNIVSLYLDSSGDSLHKRGYRTLTNLAPLNEVLAAGILKLTKWDATCPLYDGMCGSGTILIEGALIAKRIPSGAFRSRFGFERWKDFDKDLYREEFQTATSDELAKSPVEIAGSDIDPTSVQAALTNIHNAGLDADIRIDCRDFEHSKPPAQAGVVIMNPPYGERIEVQKINSLYRMIGRTLKSRCAGYRAYILSGNLDALEQIELSQSRQWTLFNGPIECRLVEYLVPQR